MANLVTVESIVARITSCRRDHIIPSRQMARLREWSLRELEDMWMEGETHVLDPIWGADGTSPEEASLAHDEPIKELILDVESIRVLGYPHSGIVLVLDGEEARASRMSAGVYEKWYRREGGIIMVVTPSEEFTGDYKLWMMDREGRITSRVADMDSVSSAIRKRVAGRSILTLCHEHRDFYLRLANECRGDVSYPSVYRAVISGPRIAHLLPVFSYAGSTETRSIIPSRPSRGTASTSSSGGSMEGERGARIVVSEGSDPELYAAKVAWYHQTMRGSPTPSGDCYDCHVARSVLSIGSGRTAVRSHKSETFEMIMDPWE